MDVTSNRSISTEALTAFHSKNNASIDALCEYLRHIPDSATAPLVFGSKQGVQCMLEMFRLSTELRVQRASLRWLGTSFADSLLTLRECSQSKRSELPSIYAAIRESAVALANLIMSDAGHRVLVGLPIAILYLLNSAVVLLVLLSAERDPRISAQLAEAVEKILNAMARFGLNSSNLAIAQNSQRALDSLYRLTTYLIENQTGPDREGRKAHLQKILEQAAYHTCSSEAFSLALANLLSAAPRAAFGESPLFEPPGSSHSDESFHQLNAPFTSFALLSNLDFEGLGNLNI